MSPLSSLTHLPPALVLHVVAAVLALALGPLAIYRTRRDHLHRVVGYTWVSAMILTSFSSFALTAHVVPIWGGFGVIHLLSVWVLFTLYLGVRAARAGDVRRHQQHMAGLYWTGLALAGAFTLLPGRLLGNLFFEGAPLQAAVTIAALVVLALWASRGQFTALRPRHRNAN